MRSAHRASQLFLAVLVLLIAALTFLDLPRPYPSWPTVGPVPVDPELVVPGLLAVVAVLGSARDGLGVGSVVVGVLGVMTLWLAAMSLYTLYASVGGGVFWGGFFTLLSGIVLAIGVIIRIAFRRSGLPGIEHRLRARIGE